MGNASSINILLVDDREENLEALDIVLRSSEYELVTALSGEEALRRLEERDFAVILMDVRMPGMDGMETARRIRSRERSRTTPIILLTGLLPDEDLIRHAYEVGAVDFISKPYDSRVLESKVAVFVDLFRKTEKIRQQEKLLHEASESRFKTIFEQSPMAILLFSPEGDCLKFNRAWERLVGAQAQEPLHAFRTPEKAPFLEAVQAAVSGRSTESLPVQYRGRWIESQVYPVFNEKGAVREVAVILNDVTERYAAEEELRRSRDQLKIIFERVADGILVQDREGRIVYANDIFARMVSVSSAERLLGGNYVEVVSRFEMRDLDGNLLSADRLPSRQAFKAGPRAAEAVLQVKETATGRVQWLVGSSRPVLDDSGTPYLVVTVFRDISEQRRTEENERLLADATAVLASSLDTEVTLGRVTCLLTPAFADFCSVMVPEGDMLRRQAYSCRDEQVAARLTGLRSRFPLRTDLRSPAIQAFTTGKPVMINYQGEETLRPFSQNDGHLAALRDLGFRSAILAPIRGRSEVLGVLSLLLQGDARRYDTVDLALAEELGRRLGMAIENARLYAEAQAQRERLQQAVQARDEFISIASHELKTPITSLILHAEMVAHHLSRAPQGELTERVRHFVATSDSQIERLSRLVEEMLDVSRIGNGKLTMAMETLDLTQIVREVLETFSGQLQKVGASATFDGPAGALVRGDRYRIEQVIANLLTNAMKYGEGKPIRVSVRDGAGAILLTVRDQGIGIAPEDHKRIFERFERAVSPSTSWVGGLGLGLYITKKIVEAHSGSIAVESSPGNGAAFTVALPKSALEG